VPVIAVPGLAAALVNEAYLKLVRSQGIRCESRVQFFALCAQIIRRILVDYARNRRTAKRGGGVQVPIDETLLGTRMPGVEVLALDETLTSLSNVDPRKGRVEHPLEQSRVGRSILPRCDSSSPCFFTCFWCFLRVA